MNSPPSSGPPLTLTPAQAQSARDIAWDRYLWRGHADPKVGWAKYLRDLAEIDKLTEQST
jgi:hypothetical protein